VSWTEERVDTLRRLFEAGVSFAAIAAELNITRNAAIGKAHRLGLYREAPAQLGGRPKSQKEQRPRKERVFFVKRSVPLPPETHAADAGPLHIGLFDLTDATCKFPFGTQTPFTFCGHATAPGLPYCKAHCLIAYQPVDQRRQKSSEKSSLWHAARAA